MTRRGLQVALGVLWLIDAGLQFQPYMFSTRFSTDVLSPAANGQASFVSVPLNHVAHLVGEHPAAFNAGFACLQLAIAAGLLLRRFVVPSLVISMVWALTVWYLGEGLGGLTGHNSGLLTGAPGAALLYAVLAAAAWTDGSGWNQRPRTWLAAAWAGYWVGGAMLQVWHGPRTGPDLAATIAENANGEPGWLGRFDFSIARNLEHMDPAVIDGFIVLQLLIGLGAFAPVRWRQVAAVAGSVICAGFWIVGPGLSGLLSGHATDPNTAPLVVVLAACVFAGLRRAIAVPSAAYRTSRRRNDCRYASP